MKKLEGKVAIVTGSGSGIGRGIALEFAKEGAKVVVNVRSSIDEANEVVELIRKEGGEATVIQGDVSKLDDVKNLVEETVNTYGQLDILVNNAGITGEVKPVAEIDEDDWYKEVDVNLNSVFLMTKYSIPHMLKQGKGKILNVGSIASYEVGSGAGYVTTKHAIIGLTKEIAHNYGSRGINCNVICPGAVKSKMTEGMFEEGSPLAPLLQATPAQRLGEPEELGKLACYLCSEDADFIHGASVAVDGGWLVK